MLMYNPLEYSERYTITPRSLWNYYRDKIYAVDNNASVGKSFRYKAVVKTQTWTPLPGYPGNGVISGILKRRFHFSFQIS